MNRKVGGLIMRFILIMLSSLCSLCKNGSYSFGVNKWSTFWKSLSLGHTRYNMDKSVLLVKAFSEDGEEDKYVKALKDAGASQVHIVPALQFVFKGEEKLLTSLVNGVGNCEGIILTSPRAAEGVLKAIEAADEIQVEAVNYWKENKICFVVGESTFEWATDKLGFKKVFGKETGNAAKLSSKIVSDYEERDRPIQFVFPCGNLKRDILPTKLAEAFIDLDCVEVYETHPYVGIEDAIRGLKDKIDSVDMVFFFSPSGATFTLPVFQQYFPDICQSCSFFAMGPSSTESLKEKGCSNVFTLNNPTVEGLINAFKAVSNGTIESS